MLLAAAALSLAVARSAEAAQKRVRRGGRPAAERVARVLLFPLDLRGYEGLSSVYGRRRLFGKPHAHRAVDLVAPAGTPVLAARAGRVAATGFDRRCGNYVRLDHAEGWITTYCHLRDPPAVEGVREGMSLLAGTVIGRVGMTGRTTGPHLHFALRIRGRLVDPEPRLLTPRQTLELLGARGATR